jgi:NAD-dependent protein deacetylase/lipoamidase
MDEAIFSRNFLALIRRSKRIMISTGAGISTESGVPAFRGAGGLWNEFKPEELATPEGFARDPRKVWEWYDMRRQVIAQIQPNAGHLALVELEKLMPDLFLFTQNIDGLHQRAGSKNIYELHGNVWNVRCTKEEKTFALWENPLKQVPPVCTCGALLRPDVVWFGEALPDFILKLAWQVAGSCDVFLAIGTSGTVEPAASLAWIAKDSGAIVVEINPESTPITEIADEIFSQKSGVLLPRLVQALKSNE